MLVMLERRLVTVCHREAARGDDAAVAVLMLIYFGLRSSEVIARQARDLDDDGRILRIPHGKTRNATRSVEVPDDLRPHLQALADGGSDMFPGRTRHWPGYHCARLCRLAVLDEFRPHALRGALSSRLIEAGLTAAQIASALGHGSSEVTQRHYVDGDAAARTEQRRRLKVLTGGRS